MLFLLKIQHNDHGAPPDEIENKKRKHQEALPSAVFNQFHELSAPEKKNQGQVDSQVKIPHSWECKIM